MKPARSFTGEIVYTLVLLAAVIVVRIIADRPFAVESRYVYGLYSVLSKTYRFLWGWIPFSLGDLLYISAGIWLIVKAVRFTRYLLRRQFSRVGLFLGAFRYFRLAIWIYLIFNIS